MKKEKDNKKTYELFDSEIDFIGKALGKFPFEISANLIGKIHKQFTEQNKPVKQPSTSKKKKG